MIMGWSSAGNIVSEQTISLYNANKLDKEALEAIIKPYIGTDCDTDTFYDKANDGKDVHEIICLTILPEEYKKVKNNLIFAENTPPEDKFFVNSNNGTDLFNKIWREMWKMW